MSLRDELGGKTDQGVFCREHHIWPQKPTRAYYVGNGRSLLVRRMWRCKCGAWASDTVRASDGAQVERRRIDYSECENVLGEPYLMVGHGRIDRAWVRRETLSRIDIGPAPDDD